MKNKTLLRKVKTPPLRKKKAAVKNTRGKGRSASRKSKESKVAKLKKLAKKNARKKSSKTLPLRRPGRARQKKR